MSSLQSRDHLSFSKSFSGSCFEKGPWPNLGNLCRIIVKISRKNSIGKTVIFGKLTFDYKMAWDVKPEYGLNRDANLSFLLKLI